MPDETAPPPMLPTVAEMTASHRRRRRRGLAWLVAAVIALPIAVKEGDVLFGENFHTVAPGELYRSAQLSGMHLERHILSEGIRTVINLRGPNPGHDWYDQEIRTCERLGIKHIDVRMSARELPHPAEARALVAALHDAPRPILVHCKNGADRSGLACAAFLVAERGVPARKASSDQLHIWYGHMPIGSTQAMDRFFALLAVAPEGESLADWVREDYPALCAR